MSLYYKHHGHKPPIFLVFAYICGCRYVVCGMSRSYDKRAITVGVGTRYSSHVDAVVLRSAAANHFQIFRRAFPIFRVGSAAPTFPGRRPPASKAAS